MSHVYHLPPYYITSIHIHIYIYYTMITRFSLSRWHSRSSAWLGSIMPEEITPSLKDEFTVCHDSDGLLTMLHSQ